ncbi:MAG: hypothetical protein HKO57_03080, partial [Akkermansiaceae bacterium]|nr:hypothetical protein [Akkermansiaceae bacterium]
MERERARRAEAVAQGQEELLRGDAAYEAGDYQEAVRAYGAARELLPVSRVAGDLRAAATQRLVQASVERARELAKGGQLEEARSLLDGVEAPGIAPNDATVREMRARIDDPLRTNPALTAEHVRNIDQVRRLLYEAQGFSELAQYDRAHMVYERILQIDPTNVAARRGLESVSGLRSEAYRAAYDETRARMLMEVDAGWDIKPVADIEASGVRLGILQEDGIGRRTAREKLKTLILPVVDLQGVDIREAVDFLRDSAAILDVNEPDPERKGFSVVIDLGTGESEVAKTVAATRFDLRLNNVPLGKVLEYINAATGTQARIDEYAIVIRPLGAVSDEMLTRDFRVPPDFLSRGTINREQDVRDPFAVAEERPGLLGKRLTAREFLSQQGVAFPEGASASFNPVQSILRVRNTSLNLDYVEQVVNAAIEDEPVVVMIETTFLNVTRDRLEELGYDWLVSSARIGSDVFLGGGTTGNGQPITDFGPDGTSPITSGLRSGDRTKIDSSIDAQLRGRVKSTPSGTAM